MYLASHRLALLSSTSSLATFVYFPVVAVCFASRMSTYRYIKHFRNGQFCNASNFRKELIPLFNLAY
jgi:hypothetical protein